MLILDRKVGQRIMIGDAIVLTLISTTTERRARVDIEGVSHNMREGYTYEVNDDVSVTCIRICRNMAKLGIDAPKSMRVDREEIRQRILAEQVATARRTARAVR